MLKRSWVRRGVPVLAALAAAAPAPAQQAPLQGFDAYVEKALRDWEVPGAAVAVVRGDSVVFARGYGVRELGKPERVDENTVFVIASITKSFTSAAVGMLVDEGKVAFDEPAARYLPDLQLPDPWVSREFTVRDMLAHRSGLERGDWLWHGTAFDRAEVVRRLRHLRPVGPFRTTYGYSNNMYIAAGQMVAGVTGKSWDDVMKERIFRPLGMTRSNTSVLDLPALDNVASPHEKLEGRLRVVPPGNLDNEGPGGSINSSVMDMTRWIRLQLAGGAFGGTRLLDSATLRQAHTPQTLMPITAAHHVYYPDVHFLTYGLGWEILDYRGEKLVHHGGAFDGMRARLAMLPEKDLGVIILTNRGWGNLLAEVLRNRVLDAYLGVPARDWSAEYLAWARKEAAEGEAYERRVAAARIRGTKPALPLAGYTGTYADEAFGAGTVRLENGRLVMTLGPRHTAELEHWHHDTFRAAWRNPALGWSLVTFGFDHDGAVKEVDVGGVRTYRKVAGPGGAADE